jgi:hypothetical protein
MNDLEVRLPHGLSNEEMRVRLDHAVVVAREQYVDTVGPIEAEWAGEVMNVRFSTMGMAFSGEVESLPRELVVRVRLPMMASLFAGRIREGIEERLGRLVAS